MSAPLGNSVTISVNRSTLQGVIALVRSADRMARAIEDADQALLEPHVAQAAADYRAIREEWTPDRGD